MLGRGVAVLLLVVGCAMMAGQAMAQSSDDLFAQVFGNTAAAEPQNVALPVTSDGRDAGDVGALVDMTAGTALVNAADLVDVLFRFVEPSTAQALIDGANAEGYLDEAAIAATGIISVFDPSNLRLAVSVPASLRPTLDLSLRDDFVPAADVSAYINVFTGLDFVTTDSSNAPGGTGRQPISTAFEGAISALGGVIQGELNYQQDDDRPWQRGDLRAVFDNEATAVRTTAGDLNYPVTGFQGFVSMAGLSNARDYNIQPYTVVQPAGNQQLLLESDSTVDVMVNGRQVDSLDLPAGPYSLSDFPVAAGANEIVLEVRDRFGRVSEITFNQFYDGSLLAPGLNEYALAGGLPSSRQDGLYRYDDRTPSFTGFYREGISDELTLGANLQGSKEVVMGGGEMRVATLLGNFLFEPAASWASGRGVDGALNLQNEYYQPLGDSFLGDRLWNFAAILRGTDFAQLGNPEGSNPVSLQLAARMSQLLTEDLSLSLGGRYGFSRQGDRDDSNNLTVLLRHRL
jgi:outer membrane usher protein